MTNIFEPYDAALAAGGAWVDAPNPTRAEVAQAVITIACPQEDNEVTRAARVLVAFILDPIPMILHCPGCHTQHIDRPDYAFELTNKPMPPRRLTAEPWTNPPHRSHLCHHCGLIWRPADVATVGVASINTVGKNDS